MKNDACNVIILNGFMSLLIVMLFIFLAFSILVLRRIKSGILRKCFQNFKTPRSIAAKRLMAAHHFSNILTMSEYTSFRVSSVGFTTPARNSFSSKAIFLSTLPLRRTTRWFIFLLFCCCRCWIHSVFIRNKKQRTRRMNRYTLTQYVPTFII